MLPFVDSIYESSLSDWCSVRHTHVHTHCYSLTHICKLTLTRTCVQLHTHPGWLTEFSHWPVRSRSSHFRSTMWHIVAGAARCWLSSEVHTEMREIERMSQMPFSVPLHPLHASVYFSKEEGVGMASSLSGATCGFSNGLRCSPSLKCASVCSMFQMSSHFRKESFSL